MCQLGPCLYVTVYIPCQGLNSTLVRPLIAKSEYFPNLSFAALFQVEYSSYDSLAWHTRVFYLVVLIEHIVDWNIHTRLSGERPRIHGVRLSVAYSIQIYVCANAPAQCANGRGNLGGPQYTRVVHTGRLPLGTAYCALYVCACGISFYIPNYCSLISRTHQSNHHQSAY